MHLTARSAAIKSVDCPNNSAAKNNYCDVDIKSKAGNKGRRHNYNGKDSLFLYDSASPAIYSTMVRVIIMSARRDVPPKMRLG